MKISVIFEFPDVDADSDDGDEIMNGLMLDLADFAKETDYVWYIGDSLED